MNWSEEQNAILSHFQSGANNLVVRARAGVGKTTVLIEGVSRAPERRILLAAFNKEIATELQKRIRGGCAEAKTLHSLGFSVIQRVWGRTRVDSDRGKKIAERAAEKRYGKNVPFTVVNNAARLASYTKGVNPDAEIAEITDIAAMGDYEPAESANRPGGRKWAVADVVEIAADAMDLACENDGSIDFDDMVYIPVRMRWKNPTYQLVCIDEAQDMSPSQLALALSVVLPTGRIVVIGDDRQCQPAGTMVRLSDGSERPIEKINADDVVTSYDRRGAAFVPRKILETASRPYAGDLVRVSVEGRTTTSTPDHRWIARWANNLDTQLTCVYVMRKQVGDEVRWRVGWCQLFDKNGALHLAQRTRVERADDAWILRVFHSRTEASIYESSTACRYGLPLIPFHEVNGAQHMTAEAIDSFFSSLRDVPLNARAQECLAAHGREIAHPFLRIIHQGEKYVRRGRGTIFETTASNLIGDHMQVPFYAGAKIPQWGTAHISREHYTGKVYSLAVQGTETYVADGIATHNCIYSWRGADSNALDRMKRELNARELPLTITRRCPKRVVEMAARIVPDFKAAPDAPLGTINRCGPEAMLAAAAPGDFVLSRKNVPLVRACVGMLKMGKRAKIRGRDLGKGLATLIRSLKADAVPDLLARLGAWEQREIAKAQANPRTADAKATDVAERAELIRVLAEDCASVSHLAAKIEGLFDDSSGEGAVICSTVHRAKGLESNRVFMMMDTLFYPSDPNSPRGREEENIRYVGFTRAKSELVLVSESHQERAAAEETVQ